MRHKWLVFLGAVSYGVLSTIVTKAYGQGYSLGQVVGSQLLTGFVLIWLLALIVKLGERRKEKKGEASVTPGSGIMKLTWKQRLLLLAAGAPTAITGLLYYQSLHYIQNSLAIVLLFQFTWMGVLLQTIVQKKRPHKVVLFTLVILFVGTLLAAGVFERGSGGYDWRGIVFGLLAAVSYTLFVLLSGKAIPSAHPVYRSSWMITGGMLLVFLLFPPTFLFDGTLLQGLLPYGFFLGLLGAFLPPLLFAIGVPSTGEGMAAILGASELPVAVLLSSVVLHEHVSGIQWFGVLLVLLGVALPELHKRWRGGQRPAKAPVSVGGSANSPDVKVLR
ncbi:EamA family transporter [Paenibacillus senegalimassiliensis]|uniref:EamA family transporter n=1 Tax=Paenibacillus senegalimassiliensis TaxID=1737426 RepID=UPI00073E896D|nr:DMT family transporter [Paenibacillus senegalimassiliensis]